MQLLMLPIFPLFLAVVLLLAELLAAAQASFVLPALLLPRAKELLPKEAKLATRDPLLVSDLESNLRTYV